MVLAILCVAVAVSNFVVLHRIEERDSHRDTVFPVYANNLVKKTAQDRKIRKKQSSTQNREEGQIGQEVEQRRDQPLKDDDGFVFHIVFSSGCNALQDWQSYMFFYHIMASGFTGNVTRVASCETDEQAAALRKSHNEQISSLMSPKFLLHTTPDYTHMAPGEKYNFFNKPFGVRHWMEHGLDFANQEMKFAKTIVVLMDPDQFLMRPFRRDMTNEAGLWHGKDSGYRIVDQGQPMAALYGFGGSWIRKLNVTELLELPALQNMPPHVNEQSRLRTLTPQEVGQSYAVGPPYVVQASDMWKIVRTWADLVVPIHQQMAGGTFLAEMFAYCMAAAHWNLPHQISRSFMISDPEVAAAEAWVDWIDVKQKDVSDDKDICSLDFSPMPHVFHFCQRFYIGPYFFSKYQIPKTPPDDVFLSCEHALFQEPPLNVMDLYTTAITLDGEHHTLPDTATRRRMAFGVCQLIPRLNAAATFYKQHHCDASVANYSKVFVHETHEAKKQRLAREKAAQKQHR